MKRLTPTQRLALSMVAAAMLLDVSERTVRRMVADGRLPHVRIGTSVRIPRVALERFLAEQARQAGSRAAHPSAPRPDGAA